MYHFVRVGWIAWLPEGFVSNTLHHFTPSPRSLISPSTQTTTMEQAGTNLASQGAEIHHLWWFPHCPPMLFREHTLHSSQLVCGLNASLPNTIVP